MEAKVATTLIDPHRLYEVRCPVHGFIAFNDWEREIISQPPFQRLRRIRQLAWTDLAYPGAMHTRFEHSLGVMHIATRMYEAVAQRSAEVLKAELAYNREGLDRHKTLVRLAALLHDLGHDHFPTRQKNCYRRMRTGGSFSTRITLLPSSGKSCVMSSKTTR